MAGRTIAELTKKIARDGATFFAGTVNGSRVALFHARTRADGTEVWQLVVESEDAPQLRHQQRPANGGA